MFLQIILLRQKFVRHFNLHSFIGKEVSRKCLVWEEFSQIRTEHKPIILVQRYEPLIKGCILRLRKTQTIPRIKPLFRKLTPWQDMTGNEKLRNRIAGNTTTAVIGCQHTLAEESLAETSLAGDYCFSWARRFDGGNLHNILSGRTSRNSLPILFSPAEQRLQLLFAFHAIQIPIGSKFLPHLAISTACTLNPLTPRAW